MKKFCRVQQMVARLTTVLLIGTLASLLGTYPAHASTLNITASVPINISPYPNIGTIDFTYQDTPYQAYAGSIIPSYLDGNELPFLYCVDIVRNIFIPDSYETSIRYDGKVHDQWVANADKVAWLLDRYASSADTTRETAALQAAIWEAIYEGDFELNLATTAADILAYYAIYNHNVGHALTSIPNYTWLSPVDPTRTPQEMQGLVTRVPEPGSTLFLLIYKGLLFLMS